MDGLYPKNRVSFLPLLARVVFLVHVILRQGTISISAKNSSG